MDSDDDGFPKQGGEALEIGDDFDSEEEVDEQQPIAQKPISGPANAAKGPPGAGGKPPEVKGQKVENQPFDLAVEVNDSEEIESDEEEDEVNVDVNVQHSATDAQKNAQA